MSFVDFWKGQDNRPGPTNGATKSVWKIVFIINLSSYMTERGLSCTRAIVKAFAKLLEKVIFFHSEYEPRNQQWAMFK